MANHSRQKRISGFTFIEVIIATAILALVAAVVLRAFSGTANTLTGTRARVVGTFLASQQIEIIRNLPYLDVGIVGGLPTGLIPQNEVFIQDGFRFVSSTIVRNIDDPFDGTLGGDQGDSHPADYKLVEVTVDCTNCDKFVPITLTTTVGPKSLEAAEGGGGLFVRVFNASGQPVSEANVLIENTQGESPISFSDVTNQNGDLKLVGLPTGIEAYEITIGKEGYSSDQTYAEDEPQNPNPNKPHATVSEGGATGISFAIDKLSALDISTVTSSCIPIPFVEYNMQGTKTIGSDPVVYKYDNGGETGAQGTYSYSNLEWDTYTFRITDAAYNLAGSLPFLAFGLLPDSSQQATLVARTKNGNALLVTVKDKATGLPISGATVVLDPDGSPSSSITGRGSMVQTDWSGGSGQTEYTDPKRYFYSDGNVETVTESGEIRLRETFPMTYASAGWLESSTFDVGIESSFYTLTWIPNDQPELSGATPVRIQLAGNVTNTPEDTWEFFGPDGTGDSYYTSSGVAIASVLNGSRYLRYRVFLSTEDDSVTPNLSELGFTYTSLCVPAGQVYRDSLSLGVLEIDTTHDDYETVAESTVIGADWQEYIVEMQKLTP